MDKHGINIIDFPLYTNQITLNLLPIDNDTYDYINPGSDDVYNEQINCTSCTDQKLSKDNDDYDDDEIINSNYDHGKREGNHRNNHCKSIICTLLIVKVIGIGIIIGVCLPIKSGSFSPVPQTSVNTRANENGFNSKILSTVHPEVLKDTRIHICQPGMSIILQCRFGKKIHILHGSWGRTPDNCLDSIPPSEQNMTCSDGTKGVTKINSICGQKNRCSITASNSWFGFDPCPNITKFVLAVYSCV